ncbi:MAG: hypothetical protein IKN62_01470 [Elusimicrobia bacterium]|nr:hypothetical protein [Elusimicrobiota bacterium]
MIKKFIVIIISVMLLNCTNASACTMTCDFSEYTEMNAALRSAVMPGWGQGWNNQKIKGWIVFGVFAVSVFGTFYYLNKSEGDYVTYKRLGSRGASYYDDYENDLNTSRILGCVAVATWVFAVVDAYLVAKKESKKYAFEKFNIDTYGKDGVMLRYKTRFSI